MGLVITTVALTMVAVTRTSSLSSIAQSDSVRSLSAAEGGVDRTIAKLNADTFNQLLAGDFTDWTNPDYLPYCYDATTFANEVFDGTIGTAGQSFSIVDYQYDDVLEEGTLTVRGSEGQSDSQIAQTIEVVGDGNANFPGLLGIFDISLGGNDVLGVDGNVVCTNRTECPVACSGAGGTFAGVDDLKAAIEANNTSVIGGDIHVGPVDIPAIPSVPAGAPTASLGVIKLSGGSPKVNGVNVTLSGNQYTIPQPGERTALGLTAGEPIYYEVSSIEIGGNNELVIDSSDGPVYFYITGDIDVSGTAALTHDSPTNTSADFRIYGADTAGTSPGSQSFSLSGNSCMDAFIFAPAAIMGIKGGGGCGANVNGAVWINEWTTSNPVGSNSTTANITVPPDLGTQLGDIQIDVSFTSGSTTLWQLEAAN